MTAPCERVREISALEKGQENVVSLLTSMGDDIKAMRTSMESISALNLKHEHHAEAIKRAFVRIEELEKWQKETSAFLNRIIGMRDLGWAVWGVFGTAITAIAVKVFHVFG